MHDDGCKAEQDRKDSTMHAAFRLIASTSGFQNLESATNPKNCLTTQKSQAIENESYFPSVLVCTRFGRNETNGVLRMIFGLSRSLRGSVDLTKLF